MSKSDIPGYLTLEEVIDVQAIFADQYSLTLTQLAEAEKTKVIDFVDNYVSSIRPQFSLRVDALGVMQNKIFGDADITGFIADLGFRFFCALGGHNKVLQVAAMLHNGLSLAGNTPKLSLIPKQVSESMAEPCVANLFTKDNLLSSFKQTEEVNVASFLESNRHLIIVYMLYLVNSVAIKAPA